MSLNTEIIFCDICSSSSFPEGAYSLTSCGGVACQSCLPLLTGRCTKCHTCSHIPLGKGMRSDPKLFFTNIQELQKNLNSATKFQINRYLLRNKQLMQEIEKLCKENRQQKRLIDLQMAKSKQEHQPRHAVQHVEIQKNYHSNHRGRANESFFSVGSHATGVSKKKAQHKYKGGFHMPNLDMPPQQPSHAKSVASRKSMFSPVNARRNQLPVPPPSPGVSYQSIPIHYQGPQIPDAYQGPSEWNYNQGNYAPSVISRKSRDLSKKTNNNIQIFK